MSVTLSDIRAAARRIAGGIYESPCPDSIPLSEITGCRIVCKLDNLQRTGSFKEQPGELLEEGGPPRFGRAAVPDPRAAGAHAGG